MPKRRRSRSYDDEIDKYRRKLKKLERKKRRREKSPTSRSRNFRRNDDDQVTLPNNASDAELMYVSDDDYSEGSEHQVDMPPNELPSCPNSPTAEPQPGPSSAPNEPQPGPSTVPDVPQAGPSAAPRGPDPGPSESINELQQGDSPLIELDPEIMEILGDDPSSTVQYGPEIRKELATRFQHVATEGLEKDARKDLIAKYLIPANCTYIDAPKVNAQIKLFTDANAKRDKGIETKQKQMASAISCLSDVINNQLSSKNKNNEILQKLMDACRLLCDIQHSDSVTRRNFIMFSVKKDMSEHLSKTKIDSHLFGQGLSDILKSAKELNRSASEFKPDTYSSKGSSKRSRTPAAKQPLNRRAPPPARRPPGPPPPPPPPRSREPAAHRASHLPPPPGYWSRPSPHQLPPPPPPPPHRRRYY